MVNHRTSRKVLISFDAKSVDKRRSVWSAGVKKKVGLGELDPQPYWGFDDLFHKAGTKLLNCFYVEAEMSREAEKEMFRYSKILMLRELGLDKFLTALEQGNVLVDFDARTGHNHGTKFRLRQNSLPELYNHIDEIA